MAHSALSCTGDALFAATASAASHSASVCSCTQVASTACEASAQTSSSLRTGSFVAGSGSEPSGSRLAGNKGKNLLPRVLAVAFAFCQTSSLGLAYTSIRGILPVKETEQGVQSCKGKTSHRYNQTPLCPRENIVTLNVIPPSLMAMHPTSASIERKCSLRGRVYTAARNALGLDSARRTITFCFSSRSQKASMAPVLI